jgi:hypothetical protein
MEAINAKQNMRIKKHGEGGSALFSNATKRLRMEGVGLGSSEGLAAFLLFFFFWRPIKFFFLLAGAFWFSRICLDPFVCRCLTVTHAMGVWHGWCSQHHHEVIDESVRCINFSSPHFFFFCFSLPSNPPQLFRRVDNPTMPIGSEWYLSVARPRNKKK